MSTNQASSPIRAEPNTVTQFSKEGNLVEDGYGSSRRRAQESAVSKPENYQTIDMTETNKLAVPKDFVKKKGNVLEIDLEATRANNGQIYNYN